MDFQQEYIEEVKQILKSLESSLMQLEKKPNDPEEIDNVYRYLHTLKGSAGMFGFEDIEKLSHALEDIFSDIREGVRVQDDVVLDMTLHSVDVFKDLIEGKDASQEVNKMINDINGLFNKNSNADEAQANSSEGNNNINEAFVVIFKPEDNVFKRGVNVAAILGDIQCLDFADINIHNETKPLELQLQNKELTSWFEILTVTNGGIEAIKDIFLFLKESEYTIIPIEGKESFETKEYIETIELTEEEINARLAKLEGFDPTLFAIEEEVEEVNIDTEEVLSDLASSREQADKPTAIKKTKKDSFVNVSTKKLDHVINIVSELVIFRSEFQHLIQNEKNTALNEAMEKLERLTLQLRDSAFNIRLVPLNIINVKFQRLIRSLSKELGKEVNFIAEGLDTEMDRSMINSLEGPLMHIIRNAIDHGLESPEIRKKRNKPEKGLLKFWSYNSGDHVFIQIQDDGNGIDFDKIKKKAIEKGLLQDNKEYSEKELINVMMTPGFSTAEKVTSVSGRGVGLDVVNRDIAALRGDIEVSTEKGLGTIITLRLPLTLTILDTLVVNVDDSKYLIPINEIEYCYKEKHAQLFSKKSRQISYEGELTPFVSLREYFGKKDHPTTETIVVVNKNDTRIALVVDDIVGKLQTVYKPLNELLQSINCFSGASILGDGSTALILDALKFKN